MISKKSLSLLPCPILLTSKNAENSPGTSDSWFVHYFFCEIVDLILKNHNFNVSVCFFGVVQVLKEASRLYAASWVRDIGPDLRPNDYKKFDDSEDESESESKSNGAKRKTKEREPSTLEDLGKTLVLMSSMYI